MSATLQLFDRYKIAKAAESDAAAGKLLGLKPSSVSNYRQGVRHAEPEVVRKMAMALGEDPELWVLKVQAERETVPARRAVWLRCVERLATAAVICLAVYTATDGATLAHAEYLTITGLSRHCALFAQVACIVLSVVLLKNAGDTHHGTAAMR